MSLVRYLYGDFQVVFRTPLAISAAVGRLAANSDQSIFHADKPQLRGYTTVNEVILWEGGDFIFNPFRPYFHGSFAHDQGVTILSGTIRADWMVKLWCTTVAAISVAALAFGSSDGFARPLGAFAIGAAGFLLLHLTIRPASKSARSLTSKIEATVSGTGANNSFKPNPLRGSA
ncbi:hypothetical protein J2X02_003728 [Pseudoxanthomonas japonensis]|uniref:hypothetical protein n=1 Tax=Pseudoxanthomonas japonensis TaxID=69284 RepID=UPI002861CAF1|nr:hypothetical protein [Pseudoxanthomonas japonensis]MDR7070857.1 hypothetical protein [Pseudoxanthomonas japonensis]